MSENLIQGVIIACYREDYWLAKISIGSVRYYYPDLQIYLLKDNAGGEFDTSDSEKYWGVETLDLPRKSWGNPGSRLSLFNPPGNVLNGRYLYIDSDVCFLGKVIERLSALPQQFIVSADHYIPDADDPRILERYYDYAALKKFDPEFEYTGYVFNGGQFVFTTNVMPQERLDEVFDMEGKPRLKIAGIKMMDQGGLNYLLPKLNQEGVCSLGIEPFMVYASYENDGFKSIQYESIFSGDLQRVAHWAGEKKGRPQDFPNGRILVFFQTHYYSRIPMGGIKRAFSNAVRYINWKRASTVKGLIVITLKAFRVIGLRKAAYP